MQISQPTTRNWAWKVQEMVDTIVIFFDCCITGTLAMDTSTAEDVNAGPWQAPVPPHCWRTVLWLHLTEAGDRRGPGRSAPGRAHANAYPFFEGRDLPGVESLPSRTSVQVLSLVPAQSTSHSRSRRNYHAGSQVAGASERAICWAHFKVRT